LKNGTEYKKLIILKNENEIREKSQISSFEAIKKIREHKGTINYQGTRKNPIYL